MKALNDIGIDYFQANPEERQKELDYFFTGLREHASDWEGKELLKSNERLYLILQKCYATAIEMCGTESSHERMKASFSEYCEKKKYKFLDTTPLVQRIVRVVFAEPNEASWKRARISTYGRALWVLQENKTAPEDVIETIKKFGGIEEVKQAENLDKPEDFAKRGKAVIAQKASLATLTSRALHLGLDPNKSTDVVLLVATRVGDTFEIKEAIQKEGTIGSVMKEIGKRHKDFDLSEPKPEAENSGPSLDEALEINKTLAFSADANNLPKISSSQMTDALSRSANKEPEPA